MVGISEKTLACPSLDFRSIGSEYTGEDSSGSSPFKVYLMVVPVFSLDDRPLDNLLDVGLSVGLLVGFVAVVILLARRLPMYSYWEMNLKLEAEH